MNKEDEALMREIEKRTGKDYKSMMENLEDYQMTEEEEAVVMQTRNNIRKHGWMITIPSTVSIYYWGKIVMRMRTFTSGLLAVPTGLIVGFVPVTYYHLRQGLKAILKLENSGIADSYRTSVARSREYKVEHERERQTEDQKSEL